MKENTMSNLSKKLIAVMLVLVTLIGVVGGAVPVRAEAANYAMNAASSVRINTSGASYYMAKENVKLRTGTKITSGTYATLQKGAIVQTNGTSGDYYKVSLDGKTYYAKKSAMKKAGEYRDAYLIVTSKSSALRKAPDQDASKTTLSAGTVLPVLGEVIHKNNLWYVVSYGGAIRFIYSGNVYKVSKITLSVKGDASAMMVGDTIQLSYDINTGANVVWSSSNDNVARVNIAGKVTGISDGTCEIRATVNGVLSVAYEVTVKGYETQIKDTLAAVKRMTGVDKFHGMCGLYAGYTVRAMGITKESNTYNGNDQYDTYKNLSMTSGGYKVTTYPASQYSLKSALNAVSDNGKKTVKNLLVCFQVGSGDLGKKYGHVMFVHAVVGGKVYFSESFSATFAGKYYTEGSPVVMTIDQFASWYRGYSFEGIVHFTK